MLSTVICLEGDKVHNFYILLYREIIGIAIQADVNSDRYKIDCTMKPLTVKSTGQMSEYTKSRTGIGAATELVIGTDDRLAIHWDGQTEKRLSVLATQIIVGRFDLS
ncbi:hypothetical protein EZS27_031920 [termite gut metagenome]|uniref:Uncharacterized protein n=1 Tax=termite gut metagenome TaxID=433724 RepID=A0A5J4QAB9_9ZZZZ